MSDPFQSTPGINIPVNFDAVLILNKTVNYWYIAKIKGKHEMQPFYCMK